MSSSSSSSSSAQLFTLKREYHNCGTSTNTNTNTNTSASTGIHIRNQRQQRDFDCFEESSLINYNDNHSPSSSESESESRRRTRSDGTLDDCACGQGQEPLLVEPPETKIVSIITFDTRSSSSGSSSSNNTDENLNLGSTKNENAHAHAHAFICRASQRSVNKDQNRAVIFRSSTTSTNTNVNSSGSGSGSGRGSLGTNESNELEWGTDGDGNGYGDSNGNGNHEEEETMIIKYDNSVRVPLSLTFASLSKDCDVEAEAEAEADTAGTMNSTVPSAFSGSSSSSSIAVVTANNDDKKKKNNNNNIATIQINKAIEALKLILEGRPMKTKTKTNINIYNKSRNKNNRIEVHLKPMFYIIDNNPKIIESTSTSTSTSTNRKNIYNNRHQYCCVIKSKSQCTTSKSTIEGQTENRIYSYDKNKNIVGCILGITISESDINSITAASIPAPLYTMNKNNHEALLSMNRRRRMRNIIPMPLLSASFVIIKPGGDNDNDNHDQSQSLVSVDKNVLLMQCLKRQLIGKLVTCPTPSSSSLPSSPSFSNSQRSIARLHVPNVTPSKMGSKKKNATIYVQVHEVLPLQKYSLGGNGNPSSSSAYSGGSNLYQIMPSTKITFCDNDAFESVKDNEVENNSRDHKHGGENVSILSHETDNNDNNDDRPEQEYILLNTIKAIRQCSNLFQLSSSSSPSSVPGNFFLDIPRAFLLSGSPGVGKTYSVRKAVEAGNKSSSDGASTMKLFSIRGSELLSSGTESDAASELTHIFDSALHFASKTMANIALLFMDECDALFSSEVVSSTLASYLDQMSHSLQCNGITENNSNNTFHKNDVQCEVTSWKRLLVVAATNRIDSIPSMLRRPGRFDRELCITPPDMNQRFRILKNLLNDFYLKNKNRADGSTDSDLFNDEQKLMEIAELCVGYVPSDLAALVRRAVFLSIEKGDREISSDIFRMAMKDVGASALRESAVSAPPATRWDDIAGDAGGAKVCFSSFFNSFPLFGVIF